MDHTQRNAGYYIEQLEQRFGKKVKLVLKGNLLDPSFDIEKIGPNDTVLVFFHQPCAVSNDMAKI